MKKISIMAFLVAVACLVSCEKKKNEIEKNNVITRLINDCGWQNVTATDIISVTQVKNKTVWVKPYAHCPGCETSGYYFQDESLTERINSSVFLTCSFQGNPNRDSTEIIISGRLIRFNMSKFAPDSIFPFYFIEE